LIDDQWREVLKLPDSDPWMKADVFYDSMTSNLYVALRDSRSLTGNPRVSQLYVYSYSSGGNWSRKSGPSKITTQNPRNLTITRDSQNRLWTTYETGGHITVGHTQPGGTTFSYANLPWSLVASKDTSAIVSFGAKSSGYKIGVMWDDTIKNRYMFAWRSDTDALGAPWKVETVYGNGVGGCPTSTTTACANYHITLRSNGDDVYAALKLMSQNSTNPLDPMIVLAHRTSTGGWKASTVSTKDQNASRQILLLAPSQNHVYVIAESPKSGLFVWEAHLDTLNFNPAAYAQWPIPNQNLHEDPTSTKQPLSASGTAIVESSQGSINQYWHNVFSAL
jgi:hypothetical protein